MLQGFFYMQKKDLYPLLLVEMGLRIAPLYLLKKNRGLGVTRCV